MRIDYMENEGTLTSQLKIKASVGRPPEASCFKLKKKRLRYGH